MSQYAAMPAAPQQPWTPPGRRRPKALWWIGGGLVLLALVTFVVCLVPLVHTIHDIVDDIHASRSATDGVPHQVTLRGRAEALLVSNGDQPACRVVDLDTGLSIPIDRSLADDDSDGGWDIVGTFPTRSGDLKVTCGAQDAEWAVASFRVGSLVGLGVGLIVAPGLLGLAGTVVLVIALVLTLTRPRRPAWPAPGNHPV